MIYISSSPTYKYEPDHIACLRNGHVEIMPFARLIDVVELPNNRVRIEFVKINESNICYAVLPLDTKPYHHVLYKNTKYAGNDILKLKMVLENESNLRAIESL